MLAHNIPIALGFYARPLEFDELDDFERKRAIRYNILPVELISLYGFGIEKIGPLSHGKFWDVSSAREYVQLIYKH